MDAIIGQEKKEETVKHRELNGRMMIGQENKLKQFKSNRLSIRPVSNHLLCLVRKFDLVEFFLSLCHLSLTIR